MKIYRVYYHDNYRCRKVKYLDVPTDYKEDADCKKEVIIVAIEKLPKEIVILNAFFNRLEVKHEVH